MAQYKKRALESARHKNACKKVVGREGLEPATLGLKVPCSTN